MQTRWDQLWLLVVAASVLSGWWLCVRPGATYRAVGSGVSLLIVLLAVVMAVLAVVNQA